jgi:L-malate glycosyltransferase
VLTVVLATYNGAHTIPHVLDALCEVTSPASGWRLVVVDNASTDGTRGVVERYADRLPLTILTEPVRGQNRCRNTGLAHVEGDLVVFMDDDTVPEPGVLSALRAAADAHPEYSIFGSTVVPRWEVPPPDWITAWNIPLGFTYTVTPPSITEGPVDAVHVFSPGMAVRTDVFEQGFRFDEQVGPRGIAYAMGSETEFNLRVAKAGHRCWHCDGSVLHHIVRPWQMTREYLLLRSLRYGRGHLRYKAREWTSLPTFVFGVPRFLIRKIVVQHLKIAWAACRRRPEALFKEQMELQYLFGEAIESRAMHREHLFTRGDDPRRLLDDKREEVSTR